MPLARAPGHGDDAETIISSDDIVIFMIIVNGITVVLSNTADECWLLAPAPGGQPSGRGAVTGVTVTRHWRGPHWPAQAVIRHA